MNVVKCDLGSICDFVFDLACEREREREREKERERDREKERERERLYQERRAHINKKLRRIKQVKAQIYGNTS